MISSRVPNKFEEIGTIVSRVSTRSGLMLGTATTLLALGIYLATIPSELSWFHYGGDGGELITASYTWGIPHPPGYPSYVVLGKLFSLMPFGSVWLRYQLFSATAMALAAGFVTATSARLVISLNPGFSNRAQFTLIAVSCGLVLAFSPLVWSQALIAEVYALNMAILAILLWTIVTNRSPVIIGLILGLSLTTHLTSIFMVPVAFLHSSTRPRRFLLFGILIGLSPYLLLPLLANSDSPVRWGEASNLNGWLWVVSARLYSANVLAMQPYHWLQRIREMNPGIIFSFVLLMIPAAIKLIQDYKEPFVEVLSRLTRNHQIKGLNTTREKQRPLPIVDLDKRNHAEEFSRQYKVLVIAAACYIIFALSYHPEDAVVLLLPVCLIFSLSIAYFEARFLRYSVVFPIIMIAVSAIFFSGNETTNVEKTARELLMQAPSEAILLSPGDETFSTLTYLISVEKIREDLILIDSNMFQFDWYRGQLSSNGQNLMQLEHDNLTDFIAANSLNYPICRAALFPSGSLECLELPNS